ncbi:hypothetical protein RhiirA4_477471 [Rhizophagus irregularis]|uniref:Uncharacterized protein n=1 Tax=Rhizophagus irregularis TaxID=588596 RepID=A0A2I1HDC4_9GLOM|nr:hypothetical protein RhiirA4_477471 [Rhizophagus irregularis]
MSDNTHNRVQQDPIPADGSDRIRININSGSHLPVSFPFHISPSSYSNDLTSFNILRLGSLNVCSLVSSTKQLNLFSILLSHALHVHFDFLALHSQRAPSYMKQRQRSRTCFDYYSVNLEQKEAFTTEVSLLLSVLPSDSLVNSLNRAWHQFKTALLSAGRAHFPKKIISLMKPKAIPHELQLYIHLSHSLDHFTISLKKFFSISSLSAT